MLYTAMTAVTTLFVVVRLYTRIYLMKLLGWDDYLVLLGWLGCISWIIICMSGKLTYPIAMRQH